MCQFQYYYEGYRSYGGYIPTRCQGDYFPGDEPGERCKLTRQECQDPNGEFPEYCEYREKTEEVCPDCDARMEKTGWGRLICPECRYKE